MTSDGIALRRTVSGPRSESGPCDRSSVLRASAGKGNAAIGSRAPIGRAWSCRNPFGRHASFDHQRKLCGSFLAPGSRHRSQASCGLPKPRSGRKDSLDRQKARGWDGRFARAECCSAARWDAQNVTKLDQDQDRHPALRVDLMLVDRRQDLLTEGIDVAAISDSSNDDRADLRHRGVLLQRLQYRQGVLPVDLVYVYQMHGQHRMVLSADGSPPCRRLLISPLCATGGHHK